MTADRIVFPLRPDRSRWLADHSPGGSPVVAGAVLAEWLLGPHGGVLRDVRFGRPLRVPRQGALVERVADLVGRAESVWLTAPRVKPDGSVSGKARVASAERHAYERPGMAAAPLAGPQVVVMIPDPTFHGPMFRVLGEPVRLGPAGLDATLRAPGPGPAVTPWNSVRDVRLLDGLFQAAGLCRTLAGLDRGAPASASSLRWAVPEGPAGVWEARIRWIDRGSPGGMNLWCVGGDGRTVWELEGYRAAPAKFIRLGGTKMAWDAGRIRETLDEILCTVFGTAPGEIADEQTFGGDLLAESLDYVDIGLHVSQRFGIPFDFVEAAEEIRSGGRERIRVSDLRAYLERRMADG